MKIIVKEDELKKIGSNLVNYANELKTQGGKVTSALSGIANVWEGEDSTKFQSTMKTQYIDVLNKVGDIIEGYGEFLNKVPGYYNESDQKMASKKISI